MGKFFTYGNIKPQATDWLWHPFIPLGKVSIIQGDPGEGKSTLALALAAAVTRGYDFPNRVQVRDPEGVVYLNAEDGYADTIRPRLDAAGADADLVAAIDESEEHVTIGSEDLESIICATSAKLVILDPLQAYLGEKVDMHRANEIRPVMHELATLAERYHCAIVLIGHMNKCSGLKSIYKGLGSIDLTAAARSVLLVARDIAKPENRVIMHIKSSLAPQSTPQAFTIREEGGIEWLGDYEAEVQDLLDKSPKAPKSRDNAETLIRKYLNQEGDRIDAQVIQDAAKKQGIPSATLYRTKEKLGIKGYRSKSGVYWYIPRKEPLPEEIADVEWNAIVTEE